MRITVLTIVIGAMAAAAPAQDPCCCDQKVCRSTCEVKKTDKHCYSSVCEDFCLPKCSVFSFHRGCDECACCENKVRTRKYLVVKVRKEETCVNKCVVEHVAPCSATPCQPGVMEAVPVPPFAAPPARPSR
jgi:hypothetical protein